IEAEKHRREIKKPVAGEELGPAEAAGGGKVEVRRRVVHRVRRPHPPQHVRRAVVPIVEELYHDKECDERPDAVHFEMEKAVVVHPQEDGAEDRERCAARNETPYDERGRRRAFLEIVTLDAFAPVPEKLERDERRRKDRDDEHDLRMLMAKGQESWRNEVVQ